MQLDSALLTLWAQLTLAGVMSVAGLGKLVELDSFIQAVIDYRVMPRHAARALARWIPWLELGSAALLVLSPTSRIGAVCTALLLAAFTGAIGINVLRGRQIHCGCMGKLLSDRIGWHLIARNGVLLVMATSLANSRVDAIQLSTSDWFPLGTLIVTAVVSLIVWGPAVDFLRESFSKHHPLLSPEG